jgi:iron complex transport system ATP-binding protein
MLSLGDVSVTIGAATLVRGVSLDVCPGQVSVVVGANGAGKTTLLRVASGEQEPSAGRVEMDGTALGTLGARTQARRRAVLPQHPELRFPFSVEEVVLMGRTPHLNGRESAGDVRIARRALRVVGMEAFSGRAFPTLSGGEQRRVHLARALAQIWEPAPEGSRYLLLDEPTASLDVAHQHEVLRVAVRLSRQGVGVLAVLHDLNLAAQYGDHLTVLKDGETCASGMPHEVITPQVIREAFGVDALVQAHPCHTCPLVVPIPSGAESATGPPRAPAT